MKYDVRNHVKHLLNMYEFELHQKYNKQNTTIVVFWVMILCDLVGHYQHVRGTYHFHLQGEVKNGGDMLANTSSLLWETQISETKQNISRMKIIQQGMYFMPLTFIL